MKSFSYECRVYESVDVRSIFLVIPHKSTENRSQDSKGYKIQSKLNAIVYRTESDKCNCI